MAYIWALQKEKSSSYILTVTERKWAVISLAIVFTAAVSMLLVPNQSPVRWVRWEMFAETLEGDDRQEELQNMVLYCDNSTRAASSLIPTWGYDQVTKMTEFSLVLQSDQF